LAEKRFRFKGSIPIPFANLANSWELAKPEKFPRAKINWTASAGWAGGGWIDCDPRERQKALAEHPAAKVLSYRPEIKDVQIVGDWAFEWNDFEVSYRETPDGKTVSLHGKALRALKKQNDGSWRFDRMMWNLNE